MAVAKVEAPEKSDPKDYKIPAVLFGIGVLVYFGYAFLVAGAPGIGSMAIHLSIRVFFQVLLGVIACMLTAKLMGASFGYLNTAVVKLAAIFVFPTAVTFFIPWVGWIIALLLYWGLLEWLFELDPMETIVLAIVIWVVNIVALLLVGALGFALLA